MAQYNICAQRKAAFQAWDSKMSQKKEVLQKDIAWYNKQVDEIGKRREALLAEIHKFEAQEAQHRAALEQANQRIEALLATLHSKCGLNGSYQWVKYCNSINWDNAKKGLPPLPGG